MDKYLRDLTFHGNYHYDYCIHFGNCSPVRLFLHLNSPDLLELPHPTSAATFRATACTTPPTRTSIYNRSTSSNMRRRRRHHHVLSSSCGGACLPAIRTPLKLTTIYFYVHGMLKRFYAIIVRRVVQFENFWEKTLLGIAKFPLVLLAFGSTCTDLIADMGLVMAKLWWRTLCQFKVHMPCLCTVLYCIVSSIPNRYIRRIWQLSWINEIFSVLVMMMMLMGWQLAL